MISNVKYLKRPYILMYHIALVITMLSCRDKYILTHKKISEFKVGDYEFIVVHVVKKDKKTDEVVNDFNDTILVNICDFYKDFKECEEDGFYRR